MGATSFTGIEVRGQSVQTVLDAFGPYASIASRILLAHGLGRRDEEGLARCDPDAWYSMEKYLAVYRVITDQAGEQTLYEVGLNIPRRVPIPPSVVDVPSALGSLDIAYHMNHRRDGQVMVDLSSGQMLEGIGHYAYRPGTVRNQGSMVSDSPYPCALDRGIIMAFLRRYARLGVIEHATHECRRRGDSLCRYNVSWKD